MPEAHETAYPRLKHNPSWRDLHGVYTPTIAEIKLAESITSSDTSKLGFLILLKTFQRLGYFVYLRDVPPAIIEHIARSLGYLFVPVAISSYDQSGSRAIHVATIRQHQNVTPFPAGGRDVLMQATHDAAKTREDLRDIINAGIEELTRARFELPGFTTLEREARRARSEVKQGYYQQVLAALSDTERAKPDRLFVDPGLEQGSYTWHTIKRDPGNATLTNLRVLLDHHHWLAEQQPRIDLTTLLP